MLPSIRSLICCGALLAASFAQASVLEVFAKGSASKNMISQDNYVVSISAMTGVAVNLIPRIRIEGRYTNTSSLQNRLVIDGVATLTDVMTETAIYSLGLDFDLLGRQSRFKPFVYLGAGYVETRRSYFFSLNGSTLSTFAEEPTRTGISANAGAGFRVALADSLALELEAFAYALDVHKPNPIINLFGAVGVRVFL